MAHFKMLLIVLYCSVINVFGQTLKVKQNCYDVIDDISHYWKKDSLTNNGYRKLVYRRLLDCQLDIVHVKYLLLKLGKPTRIDRYADSSTYYRYYYYDYKKQDKGFDGPYGYDFISFLIDSKDSIITKITHGTGEY